MKHNNIHSMWVPEKEKKEQGMENLFEELMAENFLTAVKGKDTKVQEAQRVPNKMNLKRPTA